MGGADEFLCGHTVGKVMWPQQGQSDGRQQVWQVVPSHFRISLHPPHDGLKHLSNTFDYISQPPNKHPNHSISLSTVYVALYEITRQQQGQPAGAADSSHFQLLSSTPTKIIRLSHQTDNLSCETSSSVSNIPVFLGG